MRNHDGVPLGLKSPRWFKHETAEGSLWLPFDPQKLDRRWLHVGHNRPDGGLLARFGELPSFIDFTGSWVDEPSIGLDIIGVEGVEALASSLSFETQVRLLTMLQNSISANGINRLAEERIIELIAAPAELKDLIRHELDGPGPKALYSEQIIYALLRVAVSVGGTGVLAPTQETEWRASRLLLAGSGLAMNLEEKLTGNPGPINAAETLLQMSGLASTEWLPSALARTSRIFREIANSETARERRDYCPIDEWLASAPSLSVDEQLALGLMLFVQLSEADDEEGLCLFSPAWRVDQIQALCSQLNLHSGLALDLISADRTWFEARFEEIERTLDLGPEQRFQGWNRVPFDERPLLALDDEEMVLWTPTSIINWMTEGLYFRILKSAPTKRDADRFRNFYGWLFEEHVRSLLNSALGETSLAGSGRVLAPFKYNRGQTDSPDVIIDFGPDLVFVEVYSGRLNLKSRLSGEPDGVAENLNHLLIAKARQLSNRIDDYCEGHFELEGVDRSLVRRIWPVVVVGGPLMLNELLGDVIAEELEGSFRADPSEGLSVMTPGDIDLLAGLIESGHSMLTILQARLGGHQWLDFKRFLSDSPYLPGVTLSAESRRAQTSAFSMVADRAGFDRG